MGKFVCASTDALRKRIRFQALAWCVCVCVWCACTLFLMSLSVYVYAGAGRACARSECAHFRSGAHVRKYAYALSVCVCALTPLRFVLCFCLRLLYFVCVSASFRLTPMG